MVAEDPQAHSKAPAEIPVVGGAFSLLARQWPSHGGYATLKFLFAAVSLVGGAMFMLHVVHHRVRSLCEHVSHPIPFDVCVRSVPRTSFFVSFVVAHAV